MATTKPFLLHENVIGGVDTTSPAHLIGVDKWRTQHNMRLTPLLEQIPHKYVSSITASVGVSNDIRGLHMVPTATAGYGKLLVFTPTGVYNIGGTRLSPALYDDGWFRKWSTALYNGQLYYINDLNPLRYNDCSVDNPVANAPTGRYITFWYDHAVIGYPGGFPNRLQISDLYDFTDWTPSATNESDFYDVVDWQQSDNPFTGITGVGKLHGVLWVYTPTAIIPFTYVGLPKIIRLNEEGVITRTGNSFPWTLVCLDTVHFYFDYMENMFFVFDGQTTQPIGEPVRQFMIDNLSTNLAYAQNMHAYIDPINREIWWVFMSNESTGKFDKAVVLNYRYRKWFTASVENVMSFCSGNQTLDDVVDLGGEITALTGIISQLGLGVSSIPRIYGQDSGQILQEETDDIVSTSLITNKALYISGNTYSVTSLLTIGQTYEIVWGANDVEFTYILLVGGLHVVTIVTNPGVGQATFFTVPSNVFSVFFSGSAGNVVTAGLFLLPLSADNPVLESGDFHYGDIRTVKETDAMVINATVNAGATIGVSVAGRDFLGTAPAYPTSPNATWNPTLQDAKSDYQAVPGRILRYKFTLLNSRLSSFAAFSESVYVKKAEK